MSSKLLQWDQGINETKKYCRNEYMYEGNNTRRCRSCQMVPSVNIPIFPSSGFLTTRLRLGGCTCTENVLDLPI